MTIPSSAAAFYTQRRSNPLEVPPLTVGETGLQTQEDGQQADHTGSPNCTASVRKKGNGCEITGKNIRRTHIFGNRDKEVRDGGKLAREMENERMRLPGDRRGKN